MAEGEPFLIERLLERRSPNSGFDGREARFDVDRKHTSKATQVHSDRRRELRVDVEPADDVRPAPEWNDRVPSASREVEKAGDRILVLWVDDEVRDVFDSRGSEAHEIFVPLSGGMRHPRDLIGREILFAHDLPNVREVRGGYSRRRDLNAVDRRHGMPRGEVDLESVREVRGERGPALKLEDFVFPAPPPPFDRSCVQHGAKRIGR